jgi:hypothetical protein
MGNEDTVIFSFGKKRKNKQHAMRVLISPEP